MSRVEDRLRELGLVLPAPMSPPGNFDLVKVQTAPGFNENAKVVNGFSDLIIDLWGDAGRHARSAPGQGPSPLNVPIIVDAIVAIT